MSVLNRQLPLLLFLAVSGCQMMGGSSSTPNAYPVNPPTVASTPAAAAAATGTLPTTAPSGLKVPAEAKQLSEGPYPPPGFNIPNQSGTIEVIDEDGDPTIAIASTSVTGTETNKTMSITDVPNMAGNLNSTHRYRIVFVPAKPASTP
jgi:hypothetical protein